MEDNDPKYHSRIIASLPWDWEPAGVSGYVFCRPASDIFTLHVAMQPWCEFSPGLRFVW